MLRRFWHLLSVTALLLGLAPIAWAPESTAAAELPSATPLTLSAVPQSGEVIGEFADATEPAIYVVRLKDAPLASYQGGIAGLDATSPRVTGEDRLDPEAPASVAYLSYLKAQQANALFSVERAVGRSAIVAYQYLAVLNGFAVTLTPQEAASVATLPQVLAVYRDVERELDTDVGPAHIGAPDIWGANTGSGVATRGEGIVIGVIDSGINSQHPSFAATDGDGYTHTNPFGAGVYKGWCETNPGFCNDKLIAAYTFHPNGGSPEDTAGHGSHTASTAGGNAHIATFDVGLNTYDLRIQGVAPRANIVAYKVCDPSCPTSSSVAAINSAILNDQVDVLNYSISGSDDPWNDVVDVAFLDATNAGIFIAASAGNAGPGAGTVAKTGPWNAAVAASTINRVIAHTLDVTGPGTPPALQGLAAAPGEGTAIAVNIDSQIRYSAANPLACTTFPAGFFAGSLALIQRGSCTFATKVANAAAAGATGVVIFNSVDGPPISMGGLTGTPPAFMVTLADGLALRDYVIANPGATVRINAVTSYQLNDAWQDIVAGFSSRGPSQFELLKPDFIAPGVNILAAVAQESGDPVRYGFLQGTSMSSPHAAGAGALLKALNPTWSPAEIKSALASTAEGALVKEDGVTPADPFDVGSGLLNLSLASRTGLVFDETYADYVAANPATGGDPKTLNQPSMVDYACAGSCSWQRTVRSVLPFPATYTAVVSAPPGLDITVTPATFTLAPGASRTLSIQAEVTGAPVGTHLFGRVTLQTDAQHATLSVAPVALPLDEAFTNAAFPPAGWATYKLQGGGTVTWIPDTVQSRSAPASARRLYGNDADGHQDDWLVTPPLALGLSFLRYFDRGQWMADYGYSGVWISTGSCNPADNQFVELRETPDIPSNAWRPTPVVVDLTAYAGTTACLAFRYSGTFAHTWWIDDVSVETFERLAVSDIHMPVVVVPTILTAPVINVVPDALTSTQGAGAQTEHVLTIANTGNADLNWSITEAAPLAATRSVPPAVLNLPVGGDRVTSTLTGVTAPTSILPASYTPVLASWSEAFDDINLLPGLGWALINNSAPAGITNWFQGNSAVFPAHAGAPTAYIAANFNNTAGVGTISNWLLTPEMTMQNGDQLSFYTRRTTSVSFPDRLQVRLSVAGSSTDVGATATSVGDFTTLLLDINPTYASGGYPQEWTKYVITISGLIGPTQGRLAFRYFVENAGPSGAQSEYIGIDSVTYSVGANVLYDNGPFITSYGDGPDGANVSLLQNVSLGMSTLGASVLLEGGPHWRIAEEFAVTTPGGWSLENVLLYAYQTGSSTTSTFTGVNYRIWDGPPNNPGSAVIYGDTTTNRLVKTEWTGAYRYTESGPGTARPIMFIVGEADVHLMPGVYWLDWQLAGSLASGPWQPPVTLLGETTTGDALQLGPSGWATFVDVAVAASQGMPFQLWGATVCDVPAEISWLSVSPLSGTVAPGMTGRVTVTLDSTGLAVGTYTAYLCINSDDSQNPAVVVPVSLEVVEAYTLDIAIVGEGGVAVSPDQTTYLVNDVVTLTATADPGWIFDSWSGDATGSEAVVSITITANTAVTAIFVRDPSHMVFLPLVMRN
ncbi:MAG: choice-of-anchor J domain-containing protein [Anaerolineae bacterium]|nr:choice-of-anchor J domain-containing protein [Anaerolineae bacterium]